MSVEYLDLTDYLAIAVEITEFDLTTLTTVTNVSLADSALHAPAAGFGGVDLYPDFVDKAAVLLVRLTKNHPLPDGNKRAAWLSMRIFVSVNGWTWQTRHRRCQSTALGCSSHHLRVPLEHFGCLGERSPERAVRAVGAPVASMSVWTRRFPPSLGAPRSRRIPVS